MTTPEEFKRYIETHPEEWEEIDNFLGQIMDVEHPDGEIVDEDGMPTESFWTPFGDEDEEWDRIRDVVKENARPKLILGGEVEMIEGRNITNEEAIRLQEFLRDHSYGLMMKKRKDYSGDDDPFRNLRSSEVHGVEPSRGTMVRLQDKLARIRSVMEAGGHMEVDEGLIDTFADIHNYTDIIAGLVWEVLGLEVP